MKAVKIKCGLCPRNKQYSKRTKLHKCICCDRKDNCKHKKGTVQEQNQEKWETLKNSWLHVKNPFTHEIEYMTLIRSAKLSFLFDVAMNVYEKRLISKENLNDSPLLENKGVSTNDKDLRTGIQEKEWVWTWRTQYDDSHTK